MFDMNQNQSFHDPSITMMPSNFGPGNEMFMNQPTGMYPMKPPKRQGPSPLSRIPSLYLPALIILGFSWLLHTIATFIPYWSTYDIISGSRAGLWSARYFNYQTIQNFYFPEPTDFPTLTDSISFTTSNTKGYLVTVQFLMTFNFVVMLIVLVLLAADFVYSRQTVNRPRSFLIRDYNSHETAIKFGLLLYILYIFIIFEFAAWITYVGSRQDNNWSMHVSFAFTVIVSVFLIIVFVMYVIEFIKVFKYNRMKWQYWYGPYMEWGFFVYLSALLLLLIVICCPEWAYAKIDSAFVFREIGLFKQCYSSAIYKKNPTTDYCTLSDTKNNQAWVNATQAFMLIAYIIGMIILVIIVLFRREFRHNETGYFPERTPQPLFTFIIAGLILFFCFIFTLIGISIFGGEVFSKYSIGVNWAYILAVFAMVLFLITGILFILDAVHSRRQAAMTGSSGVNKFFFPPPLNHRVLATQPLLNPQPAWQTQLPGLPPPQQFMPQFNYQQQPMFPPSFPQEPMIIFPTSNGVEMIPLAPIAQAGLTQYFRQIQNNPQLPLLPTNQGLISYLGNTSVKIPDSPNTVDNEPYLSDMVRQHFVQQQRLNYNHERLLERYRRIHTPHASQFSTFGSSTLPGRNYDGYLDAMRDDHHGDSLAAISRAGIGSSEETYRWMGDESNEPLPRNINTRMQHNRDEPMSFVDAENFEPVKIYDHPIFGSTPPYIRSLYSDRKYSETISDYDQSETEEDNEIISNSSDHRKETKSLSTIIDDDQELSGYLSYKNSKTKHEHLIPVNPHLFKIYTQRSNGSIQSYGQSLYVPSSHHKRSSHYEVISNPSPSDTNSISTDNIPHKTSSSSNRPLEPLPTENDGNLSDEEANRPDFSTSSKSRTKPNKIAMLSLSSTISSAPVTALANPPITPMPGTVSTQDTSIMNNIGTTTASSNQRKVVSFDNALSLPLRTNDSSSSSGSDDDDDDDDDKKTETHAITTVRSSDVNYSPSDD